MPDRLAKRRPRPVADAPVAALVEVAEDLAKRWLLGLIAAVPLESASLLPVAQLAREAPLLCAAVGRALASDAELVRLEPGGDLVGLAAAPARLAGARDAASAAAAVDILRQVLWSEVRERLVRPSPELVAELAERLAAVCATLTQAVLSVPGEPLRRGRRVGPSVTRTPPAPFVEPNLAGGVALHDVRDEGLERQPSTGFDSRGAGDRGAFDGWGEPHRESGLPQEPAWMTALERGLERQDRDGTPFAALVIEADGVDRLLQVETGREVAGVIEGVGRAISGELGPEDLLLSEGLGRYWLVAPDTDAEGARLLADHVAQAVRATASHRGAPLTVSIGMVVAPDDGTGVTPLAQEAEERLYAARAAGRHTISPTGDEVE
jgi:GGDEF domain-containing protein